MSFEGIIAFFFLFKLRLMEFDRKMFYYRICSSFIGIFAQSTVFLYIDRLGIFHSDFGYFNYFNYYNLVLNFIYYYILFLII